MPRVAYRPDALAWQVFRGSEAVHAGLLTGNQLRSSAWARVRHDVYADARLDQDHRLACRAVLLRAPAGVRIAGPSAAHLHGVEHAASFTDDVHVIAPAGSGLRSQRGLRVHSNMLDPDPDPDPGAGRPSDPNPGLARRGHPPCAPAGTRRAVAALVTSDPTTAAWETGVWLETGRAVSIIDTLLARGSTSRQALATIAAHRLDRSGGKRAARVFDLVDPGAESPPESQLRVRLVLAGLPRPVSQHPVRLRSGLILHPDLAWPEFRVAVEYDGQWHADADQLHRDRQRLNQLAAAGWLVLHVTSRRMRRDFPGVVREIRAALIARGWRPRAGAAI
ncbi:DUF559 domain-containing protein [Micromonospora sp. NPDC050495]|uniref:endonuclease domain-containing protein n=1 Tax=Micromonospora sp. NPDC050495 TaxID=3154936 RepID=UPI003405330A